jgi:hypothetical protein
MTIHPLPFTHLRQTGSARFGWRLACGMALGDRGIGIAEWSMGYSNHLSHAVNLLAQAVHTGACLFASFDFHDGIDLPMAGHQLAGSHLEQRSGRYRLAVLL